MQSGHINFNQYETFEIKMVKKTSLAKIIPEIFLMKNMMLFKSHYPIVFENEVIS
jgi:hypothetical protein